MAEVVEYLTSKSEAPSSNPRTTPPLLQKRDWRSGSSSKMLAYQCKVLI
jgi:hypothetical protein